MSVYQGHAQEQLPYCDTAGGLRYEPYKPWPLTDQLTWPIGHPEGKGRLQHGNWHT